MRKLIIYILLLISAIPAIAQSEHPLSVSEMRQQTILSEPITLQKGYFKAKAEFNYYFFSTDKFNDKWQKMPNYGYLSNSFVVPFSLNYGITNNLEIAFASGYTNSSTSGSYKSINYYNPAKTHQVNSTKIENGFSDFTISTAYKFFSEKASLISMGVGIYLTIPYGKTEPTVSADSSTIYDATSRGFYELGVEYIFKKVFYPFSISGIIRYANCFPADLKLTYSDTTKTHIKLGNYLNGVLTFNYMPCDWIGIRNSISYTSNAAAEINYEKDALKVAYFQWNPELSFQLKNFRLSQGIMVYLKGKNTPTAPLAYISLGVKF